jgi:hypothetical protein
MLAAFASASAYAVPPNEILRVTVATEDRTSVTFRVDYTYSGDHGDNVFMVASMVLPTGETSAAFTHRVTSLEDGHHRTEPGVQIDFDGTPDVFSTVQVEIAMYTRKNMDPFFKRNFEFSKTWVKRGSLLHAADPKVGIGGASGIKSEVGKTSSGEVVRRILRGGLIELRYTDGSVQLRCIDGKEPKRDPNGRAICPTFRANTQGGTPPSPPPNSQQARWMTNLSDRLLETIKVLIANDDASLQQYLGQEGTNSTLPHKVESRSLAIQLMVQP